MEDSISSRIHLAVMRKGLGATFTSKDFAHLGDLGTVRKNLDRMARSGEIRRVSRGIYDRPAFSALFASPEQPSPDAIAKAIARSHGWTLVASGATALNLLGLSTQVPATWEYVSDGPSKEFRWSGGTLHFRHCANKEITCLSPGTALVVQALKALGRQSVTLDTLAAIRARMTAADLARALREGRYITAWVYKCLRDLAMDGERCHA